MHAIVSGSEGMGSTKRQDPNTKTPIIVSNDIRQTQGAIGALVLELGVWIFSGAWSLDLGAFAWPVP
jgi:hypothetical protein